jgi:hypothetical protein
MPKRLTGTMVSQIPPEVTRAYEKALAEYGGRHEVTGVDVGYRYKDRQRCDELAVRIHVTRKLPPSELTPAALFPEAIDGVPVDVIEAEYSAQPEDGGAGASESRTKKGASPVKPGMSVGHEHGGTGTLGAVVFDKSGRECLLSCWHVLAGPDAKEKDAVVQPGRLHQGHTPNDVIGELGPGAFVGKDGDAAFAVRGADARKLDPRQVRSGDIIRTHRAPV